MGTLKSKHRKICGNKTPKEYGLIGGILSRLLINKSDKFIARLIPPLNSFPPAPLNFDRRQVPGYEAWGVQSWVQISREVLTLQALLTHIVQDTTHYTQLMRSRGFFCRKGKSWLNGWTFDIRILGQISGSPWVAWSLLDFEAVTPPSAYIMTFYYTHAPIM